MANVDNPRGFRWHRRGGGNGSAYIAYFPIADATEVDYGDPVKLTSGEVEVADSDDDILGVAAVQHPPDGVIPGDWYKGLIGVMIADRDTEWVVQATSGEFSTSDIGAKVDIEGSQGEKGVDLGTTTNGDFLVLGIHPNDEEGEDDARVIGRFVNTVMD